ncbi:hypothetical protein GBAR_LOCUS12987 [Geodia barretti]|uniref:Secreted protein n=1 Tax=Geodia barretti TaxID=519541 RepID=A0AA35S350_GEOBA|nr:hypothetical protein GBAR_LOCUS12987 [Geodia barretti]
MSISRTSLTLFIFFPGFCGSSRLTWSIQKICSNLFLVNALLKNGMFPVQEELQYDSRVVLQASS